MKQKLFSIILLFTLCITPINVGAASVKDFLSHALEPIGKCLYVYGGGWNEPDTAAGFEAMTYGISPRWQEFYLENDASYNYKNTRYQIHDGLDCTGYVGWSVYQVFGDNFSTNGYVYLAETMAQEYAKLFDSTLIPKNKITNYQSGDVMSSPGHAYIVLGGCDDGSIVFLHASPPAVSICGTYTPGGNANSQAVALATYYMRTYFPECYNRYPRCSRNTAYLTDYSQMRWNETVLTDSDGYRLMSAEEILKDLFESVKLYLFEQRLHFSVSPFLYGGTTYVPLREISEMYHAEITWDNATRKAQITASGKTMTLDPSSSTVVINGETLPCDLPIVQDRIMIPIRPISNFLGFSVSWDGSTKSIYLN